MKGGHGVHVLACVLADRRWAYGGTNDDECSNGAAAKSIVQIEWMMPEQPANPFPRLIGARYGTRFEPCPGSIEGDIVLELIAD